MYEEILKYQNCDIQIYKLKRDFAGSELYKFNRQLTEKRKHLIRKSEILESEAEKLIETIKSAESSIEENTKTFDKLKQADIDNLENEKIKEKINDTISIINNMSALQKKVSMLTEKAENVLREFKDAKIQMASLKDRHVKMRDDLSLMESEMRKKITEIESEKKKIEKKISSEILQKYNESKNDKIFPVFVKCYDNSCGGCRQQLASSLLENLKNDGKLVCEHCGRIIIN